MPDKDLCEIIVLLDRSGSMASVKGDMEGGFNAFVAEQKKMLGAVLTLVQFDSNSIDTVHEAKPIGDVPALHLDPRGSTPLLDAMGKTINSVGQRYGRTPEEKRPGRVLFLVITDGHENASHEFTRGQIKVMVEHQTNAYGWQFSYLGANVDAFAEAGDIGISRRAASAYAQTKEGVREMFMASAAATMAYRSGEASSYTLTDEQRAKMGHKPS